MLGGVVTRFINLTQIIGPIAYAGVSSNKTLTSLVTTPFQQSFIIRGVGYRSSVVPTSLNDKNAESYLNLVNYSSYHQTLSDKYTTQLDKANKYEFPAYNYLMLRLGHSAPIYYPIPSHVKVKIMKKDRKLTLMSQDAGFLAVLSHFVYKFRPPSVYTGRGVRFKGLSVRRKLGKKDIRKGRFF